MEGRLFGVTEAEKNHQERVKAHALLSCQKERAILQRCFRESWFGWCVEEHREFWDCFLKAREQFLIKTNKSYSKAPDTHWEETPNDPENRGSSIH